MKFAGIIAEYDPFHNGHAWQLAQAKALGAEHVAVAMSCGLTQRGSLPLLPEAVRVQAALQCGADLIFALPAPCACAGAEAFARAGVRILAGAAGALCAKIIEACRAQDCRLNRRPEEVLNIMQNTPAKPLCKGPQAVVLPLHCLPRRSNALCHKAHFRQWQVLCHSATPAISEQKTARQKQGASRRTHPASLSVSHNVR